MNVGTSFDLLWSIGVPDVIPYNYAAEQNEWRHDKNYNDDNNYGLYCCKLF